MVVEGLGYGYSDLTGLPRTIENITADLHEALTVVKIEQPYILLGHSIAGIYDLYYANRYRAEVSAVIEIDASVPGQINGMAGQASPWNRLAATTGLLRVVTAISPSLVEPDSNDYTADELHRIRMMTNWNWSNPALLDEADQSDHNFAAVRDLTYARDLPVLSFIKTGDNPPHWRELHLDQLRHVEQGRLVELDGGHYLHWTHATTIAQRIRAFLQTANVLA